MSYEEDVYTEIFSALKHPIRRRILKMLEQENHTYTSLLNGLGIESGLLTYHLENLGSLIGKTDDGKYRISEFGQAALKLTKNIEDPIKTSENNYKLLGFELSKPQLWKALIVILVATNLYSLYFYEKPEETPFVKWSELEIEISYNPIAHLWEETSIDYFIINTNNYTVKISLGIMWTGEITYEDYPNASQVMNAIALYPHDYDFSAQYRILEPQSKYLLYRIPFMPFYLGNATILLDGFPPVKIEVIP